MKSLNVLGVSSSMREGSFGTKTKIVLDTAQKYEAKTRLLELRKMEMPLYKLGKKVKTVLLSSLIVLALLTLITSQAVLATKEQPKQAVDTPSASPTKSGNDQQTSPPTDDGSKDKTNTEEKGERPPAITEVNS
jgi:hypothetical protein